LCNSVDEYRIETATLRLKHDNSTTDSAVIANVDIEHVLETLRNGEVDVGAWINVIGYVERREEKGVFVQAIAAWDAGNVDLDAYERAVERRKAVE